MTLGPWGRMASVTLRESVDFRGFVALPAGTELRFADSARWLARATPDRVSSMVLPEGRDDLHPRCGLDGPPARSLPGATVGFDREGRVSLVEGAFGAARLDGRALVGSAPIGV